VFADPANGEARALQADALEQMGYQAESGPWRDFYLTGAQELRNRRPASETPRQGAAGQLRSLPADALLESLAVRLNGTKAGAIGDLALTMVFNDAGERFAVSVENAVLHHKLGEGGPVVTLTRPVLIGLVIGETTLAAALADGTVSGQGASVLGELLALLDRFDFWFEIVTP
jgi:alkyl sulfatase BDS1-like metallo-beta-lactamase superfamily hydrolase